MKNAIALVATVAVTWSACAGPGGRRALPLVSPDASDTAGLEITGDATAPDVDASLPPADADVAVADVSNDGAATPDLLDAELADTADADDNVAPELPAADTTDAGDAIGDGPVDAGVETFDEEVLSNCPDAECTVPWETSCTGPNGYTVCGLNPDTGCPEQSLVVSCKTANACNADSGVCEGACVQAEVMLVVDRSSSTDGTTWGFTVSALTAYATYFNDTVALGLRQFPGDASGCSPGPIVDMQLGNATAVLSALQPPSVAAFTPLAAALTDLPDAFGDPAQGEHVIVITDGTETCAEQDDVITAIHALRSRGTSVHAIGLGAGFDAALLGQMASEGGGLFLTADDEASLDAALKAIAAATTGCAEADNGSQRCVAAQCVLDCAPGYHVCDDACVANGAVATCGRACSPCPVPAIGAATCDGSSCGIACDVGYMPQGGACVPSTATDCCGVDCVVCPGDPNGAPTCDGQGCGLDCAAGFHGCGGACVADDDPAHCGTACAPCPDTDPVGTPVCVAAGGGFACGYDCGANHTACGGGCVSKDDPAYGCGDVSCAPCVTPPNAAPLCDGTGGANDCAFACDTGYEACGSNPTVCEFCNAPPEGITFCGHEPTSTPGDGTISSADACMWECPVGQVTCNGGTECCALAPEVVAGNAALVHAVVSASGASHVLYRTLNATEDLGYATNSGAAGWVNHSMLGRFKGGAIAADPFNTAHIVAYFQEGDGTHTAYYTAFAPGPQWHNGSAYVYGAEWSIDRTEIALDGTGEPHLLFDVEQNGVYPTELVYVPGGDFAARQVVASDNNDFIAGAQLAAGNKVHIIYYDDQTFDERYRRYDTSGNLEALVTGFDGYWPVQMGFGAGGDLVVVLGNWIWTFDGLGWDNAEYDGPTDQIEFLPSGTMVALDVDDGSGPGADRLFLFRDQSNTAQRVTMPAEATGYLIAPGPGDAVHLYYTDGADDLYHMTLPAP